MKKLKDIIIESLLDDKLGDKVDDLTKLHNKYKIDSFSTRMSPDSLLSFLKEFDWRSLKKYATNSHYSFSVFREYNKKPITIKIEVLVDIILHHDTFEEAAKLIKNHNKKIVNYDVEKQFSAYGGVWVINVKFYNNAGDNILILRFEEK